MLRLLTITGISRSMTVLPTLEEALAGWPLSRLAHSSSPGRASPCVPGRGAQGSSSAGRTTTSRSPRTSWVTAGSK